MSAELLSAHKLLKRRGFPPALAQYKSSLNSLCPELPKENPGSKWPKTSLGALKDHQRLTPEQLSVLMALCRQELFAKMIWHC